MLTVSKTYRWNSWAVSRWHHSPLYRTDWGTLLRLFRKVCFVCLLLSSQEFWFRRITNLERVIFIDPAVSSEIVCVCLRNCNDWLLHVENVLSSINDEKLKPVIFGLLWSSIIRITIYFIQQTVRININWYDLLQPNDFTSANNCSV